jgi:asparagine synthase (glutamine-hydrolysing)
MCGILGVVGRELSRPAVDCVLEVLQHRGPDGNGRFTDEAARVTLLHTRLKVIDPVTGAQPLESDDGTIVLVANGEIYDFEAIRDSLEAKGHRFRTKSDSEVIIYLYKEFGLGCFEQLRGEFAFLLYDKAKRLLIAARDRFGIKPLFFSRLDGGFVFASEMKALFASGLVEASLNVAALDPFLDQDPADVRFPFEGIEQVPPASYVTIDLDSCRSTVNRYWSAEIPDAVAEPVEDSDGSAALAAAASVLRELEEAVRLRLRADVPVGLYLSGGIDSAFLGALMTRNSVSPLHSFSISFEGSGRNEREFARRSAEFLGTEHHEFAVTKAMLWNHLEQCLWFSELPFLTLAPVGKLLLSEEARKVVTVVLTGEGADEVFLGYPSFFRNAIRDTRRRGSRQAIGSAQVRRLKIAGVSARAAQTLSLRLFHKNHRRRLAAARADTAQAQPRSKPVINAVQESRIAGMPLDVLCYLGDRVEMASSLEARLPFLDHKLFNSARTIPVDFKMSKGVEKAVLRDAAKGILPDDIRLRRKSGFMLTSEAVDFFGADSKTTEKLRRSYLSKRAFARSGVFSYRAFLAASILARAAAWNRPRFVGRLRRNSNKIIMYMMQVHMLHEMFVASPPWAASALTAGSRSETLARGEMVNAH